MSYTDAMKIKDTIHIVERVNGKRLFKKIPANYIFYSKNPNGEHVSMFGDTLKKFETSTYNHFKKEMASVRSGALFEHDVNPVFRCLDQNYANTPAPSLHVAAFDIEVDFDPNIGFSSPEDPYAPINAVSIHQSWTGRNLTYTLKPDTLTWDEAAKICDSLEDTWLCTTEEELYDKFFDAIEDADVLTGWNSTFFDIPYMVERLIRIKNKEATKRFCLWNQAPRKKIVERFGKEQLTYDLYGRVHLDYLDLYQKYTYHEMHSYSLDAVGEHETGQRKVAYSGSLDKLYKNEYKLFLEYNKQDVMLIVYIDNKNEFIDLSNNLAHEMSVLLQTTLGSVALIETAIVNEVHSMNLITPSKKPADEDKKSVAGAYVAVPTKGMHDWVGSVDINSLYPSIIRSLNISPETIVGQLRLTETSKQIQQFLAEKSTRTLADAWGPFFGVHEYNHVVEEDDTEIIVDFEDGSSMARRGKDWKDVFFNDESNVCMSANGTLFRTDKQGIIPNLLERWYNERVIIRKEASDMFKEMNGVEINDELGKLLE